MVDKKGFDIVRSGCGGVSFFPTFDVLFCFDAKLRIKMLSAKLNRNKYGG